MRLESKRNFVEKLDIGGAVSVRKHFYSADAWRAELDNHALIRKYTRTANITAATPGVTVSEYLPHLHMLKALENQEANGFSENMWHTFARWLKGVSDASGIAPAEGNLRNFLWDDAQDEIIPIDLEHWQKLPFHDAAVGIAAFLMEYKPSGSAVKRRACGILCEAWGIGAGEVDKRRDVLREARKNKAQKHPKASLILLAGGKSTRMSSSKARLPLLGKTMLEHQLETACLLGIDDILVSGAPDDTGYMDSVADVLESRGPLGGIYSCMKRAKHDACLVLGVDMPFMCANTLSALLEAHESSACDITLAVHDGKTEPLAGVYNSSLTARIGSLIAESGAPVRSLLQRCKVNHADLDTNSLEWYNCNTPEAYAEMLDGELTQSILRYIQS